MSPRLWSVCLRLGALAGLLALAVPQGRANKEANEASEARLRRDVTYLASDECEGRGPGTRGIDLAAAYIANEFKKAGLKPGGVQNTYFQPFTIAAGASKLEGSGSLRLTGPQGQQIELQPGAHFEIMGPSGGGKVNAPLVFAGFGVTTPQGYDDYKGLDVKGKVVVVVRRVPRWDNKDAPFGGSEQEKTRLAALVNKFLLADANRAAAVLLVNDSSEEQTTGDQLVPFKKLPGFGAGASVPVLHVRRSVLDGILLSSLGRGLRELEQDISRELKPQSVPLPGWSARIEAPVKRPTLAVKNVIGVLEGAGPLANETVVVGAHYDHLGYGGSGSLSKNRGKKEIHHGADDNGSGTTAMMELARRCAAVKGRQGRRLVFMAFSAEERGLLGSRYYCDRQPLFPLDKTVAMVNLDMVGRLSPDKKTGQQDRLIVEGVKTGVGFEELIDKLNEKEPYRFLLAKRSGASGYSDHASFYARKVPVMFLWTDTHKDYHRPSDTAEKINVEGMRRITDMAEELVKHFAGTVKRPQYVAVSGKTDPSASRPTGKGPTLGVVPEYAEGDKGLTVSQVIPNRPAAKAGLKDGDVIVELAGREIRNITVYTAVLQTLVPGREVPVVVLRGGKRLTLKVTPQ